MPASAGDGEEVKISIHVAEDFDGRVMLEEQIHFNRNTADVLENC